MGWWGGQLGTSIGQYSVNQQQDNRPNDSHDEARGLSRLINSQRLTDKPQSESGLAISFRFLSS
jgi:hypothetical protein